MIPRAMVPRAMALLLAMFAVGCAVPATGKPPVVMAEQGTLQVERQELHVVANLHSSSFVRDSGVLVAAPLEWQVSPISSIDLPVGSGFPNQPRRSAPPIYGAIVTPSELPK